MVLAIAQVSWILSQKMGKWPWRTRFEYQLLTLTSGCISRSSWSMLLHILLGLEKSKSIWLDRWECRSHWRFSWSQPGEWSFIIVIYDNWITHIMPIMKILFHSQMCALGDFMHHQMYWNRCSKANRRFSSLRCIFVAIHSVSVSFFGILRDNYFVQGVQFHIQCISRCARFEENRRK